MVCWLANSIQKKTVQRNENMEFQGKPIRVRHILIATVLLLSLVLGLFISIQPHTVLAQAAPSSTKANEMGRRKAGGFQNGNRRLFVITGTVAAANANQVQVNLKLPERRGRNGRNMSGVNASKPVTFTVGAESLIFDKNLSKLAANNLQVGSTVTVFPKRAWGEPTIQLLFVGEPSALATFAFQGQLVEDRGNTLVLKPRNGTQFNVIVDTTTTWLDQGVVGRPTQIRPNMLLRVLGTKSENGDVKAVLITAMEPIGRMGRRIR
jgi:hypothetical protein